ncbi:hypothetical protein J6590_020871 [Homalodisca vitripennis]|nr:hypothetical protein J6590_020871 [Homalodisca vitripennis]
MHSGRTGICEIRRTQDCSGGAVSWVLRLLSWGKVLHLQPEFLILSLPESMDRIFPGVTYGPYTFRLRS